MNENGIKVSARPILVLTCKAYFSEEEAEYTGRMGHLRPYKVHILLISVTSKIALAMPVRPTV